MVNAMLNKRSCAKFFCFPHSSVIVLHYMGVDLTVFSLFNGGLGFWGDRLWLAKDGSVGKDGAGGVAIYSFMINYANNGFSVNQSPFQSYWREKPC